MKQTHPSAASNINGLGEQRKRLVGFLRSWP
jgi:hypothetical protein